MSSNDNKYDARPGSRPVGQLTFLPGDPTTAAYVRVLRVVEYIGPRAWVEDTMARSIQGAMVVNTAEGKAAIRAGTIGLYEVLGGVIGIAEAPIAEPEPEPEPAVAPEVVPSASFDDLQAKFGNAYTEDPTQACLIDGTPYRPGDRVTFFGYQTTVRGVIPGTYPKGQVILADWLPEGAKRPFYNCGVYAFFELKHVETRP